MKRFIIVLVLLSAVNFTFIKCKMDGSNSIQQLVPLNLESWNLPDTVVKSTPFNLVLRSSTESTCYGKIIFVNENYQEKNYVYAQSLYVDNGNGCSALTTEKDSTISITIDQAGRYYYNFRKDDKWNKDSIEIILP